MDNETNEQRIERLKSELDSALKDAGYLPIGTRVTLTGTIIGVDIGDKEYPYKIVVDGDKDDDDGTRWYPATAIKEM